MFGRLSLTKKVLLLVAVPLVVQIGFIGVMGKVLVEVEQERRQEMHARDLAAGVNTFLRMSMGSLVQSILYYFALKAKAGSDEAVVWKRQENVSNALRMQVDTIRHIVEGHPEEELAIQHIETLLREGERHAQDARNAFKVAKFDDAVEQFRAMKETFRAVNDDAQKMVDEQLEIEKEQGILAEKKRRELETLLVVGVIVNVILAIGMVTAFNRSLINRLLVLSDNTVRLAAGKPLNPAIEGKDEIAHLDEFFRKMAQALADAREKEKEIERLKRDFVAMVSHDLRTPLTSIQMFHSTLLEGLYGNLTDRGKQNLEMIETEVDRLIGMVNELLNIEKLESGTMELELAPVALNDLLKRSADAVSHLAMAKDVQIVVDKHDPSPNVTVDEERLLQVMINLLGNAIKFAPDGSEIDIVAILDKGPLEIQVRDRNRTIPADLQQSIFDRFKQVDRSDSRNNKGTGLGLAICKAIVERHGGIIGVKPRDGGGNIFWFTLPQADEDDGKTINVSQRVATISEAGTGAN